MKNELQLFLNLDNNDTLLDVKVSLDGPVSASSEIAQQVANIVKVDSENLLNEFIDY